MKAALIRMPARFACLLSAFVALSGLCFAQSTTLAYRPIAAEYSGALDRIIMISSAPDTLHIHVPGQTDTPVSLMKTPLALAISPDGLYAAIGHEHLVSYVNLSSATVERTFAMTIAVQSVTMSAGWIYAFSGGAGSEAIDLSSGAVIHSNLPLGGSGKLNPSGSAIYGIRQDVSPNDLVKFDISSGFITGQTDSIYNGEYSLCGQPFFSASGDRIYTGCGTAFTASDDASSDMRYAMTLPVRLPSGVPLSDAIHSLSESEALRKIAILSADSGSVQLYDRDYLTPAGSINLLTIPPAQGNFPVGFSGKWVFFNASSTALYVIAQADSGVQPDSFAVQRLSLAPSNNCGAFQFFSSIQPDAEGAYTSAILTGTGCVYQAVSLVPWIKIVSGGYGSAGQIINLIVRGNPGAARTGQIVAGGNTFTVNQGSGFTPGRMTRLPYDIVAAEYSRTLNKLIGVSSISGELHIYDPDLRADTPVSLPKPPLAVALSADGLRAAVLHDGFISYVNLSSASVERVFPIPVNASSITLGGNWAYALGSSALHSAALNLETGAVYPVSSLFPGTGQYNAAVGAIYGASTGTPTDLVRFNVSTGPITGRTDSPYNGEYPICGPVFFSPTGDRIYTGCSRVFSASTNAALDMRYKTTLRGAESVRSLAESSATRRVALIQGAPGASEIHDNKVLLYESDYLNPLAEFLLADIVTSGTARAPHGRSVFFNADATKLHVVVRGGGPAGFNNFGVQTIPLVPSGTSCGAAFTATSASAPAAGSTESVSITAPLTCVYQAVSNVPWIQILSGGYGSGDRAMQYIVRPNSGSPRTGTISIGNADLTVTQAGAGSSPETLPRLSYDVASAAYSKALDRLILTASSPTELHVYDAITQSDLMVALPLYPQSLVVSPDGNYATVGHDGWISYVDLRIPRLLNIFPVNVGTKSLLLTSSRIYAFNSGSTPTSILLSDSSTAALSGSNGAAGKLSVDGSSVYIAGSAVSKWSVADGEIMTPRYSSPVETCGTFWLTGDGRRMITSCGSVYRTSATPAEDLQRSGSLSTLTSVLSVDQSTVQQSIAVLPSTDGQGSTQVELYNDADLAFRGNIPLPLFRVGPDSYLEFGRFVSWNRDESKLIVLVRIDDSLELASPFALNVLSAIVTGQIPVATSERGSFSTTSNGSSGAVSVGYATVRVNPGSSLPAGSAIFGARNNGVLVSEATVPATRTAFSGRVYAEVDGQINTGIAIANPNISPATVRFAFTNQNGVNLHAGSTTIPARSQIAKFFSESPFDGGASLRGTFTFISDVPVAAIALRSRTNERAESLLTTLPVAALGGPGGGSFLFPSFATGGGWTTQFVLVNPGDAIAGGTLRFYSQGSQTTPGAPLNVTLDGQTANTFTYSIPPNSSRNLTLSGSGSTTTVGSARVTASPGQLLPSGVAIFSQVNNAGVTTTEAGVPGVTPFQALRLYVEASNDASHIQSGIAVTNDAASAISVSLELFNLSGTSTGLTGNLTLPANGQAQLFLNQVNGFQSMPAPFKGVLRITGDFGSRVSVIGLRTRVNERGEFLITTTHAAPEGTNTFEEEQHFPHFADGGGYTTQFILMNVSPTLPFAGGLEFYDPAGTPLNLAIH